MSKQGIYIGRQLLLALIALQILNLSVGSQTVDAAYDYSYTYNKNYDPTESAVEWIVELKCGQQPAFSYNTHQDTGKSPIKSLHWKTDLQSPLSTPVLPGITRSQRSELPVLRISSPAAETFSPPPESNQA